MPHKEMGKGTEGVEEVACEDEFDATQRHSAGVAATAVGDADAHGEHEGGGSEGASVDVVEVVLEAMVHVFLAIDVDEGVDEDHEEYGKGLGEVERPLTGGVDFGFCKKFHKLFVLFFGVAEELKELLGGA